MKNIFLSLTAIVLLSQFCNSQTFEESVAMIPYGYVMKGSTQCAQSYIIKSFDLKFRVTPSYGINGIDYTDDGKYNDEKAADGIYTSTKLRSIPTDISIKHIGIYGSTFKYRDDLIKWGESNRFTIGVGVHCKMRVVYTGTTILGFSCASGCIELYDCTLDIGIGWNKP